MSLLLIYLNEIKYLSICSPYIFFYYAGEYITFSSLQQPLLVGNTTTTTPQLSKMETYYEDPAGRTWGLFAKHRRLYVFADA